MAIKKQTVRAVHDADLDELIRNLGLLEPLGKRELRCALCGKSITKEDIACFYAEENEVKVCCKSIECFEKALESRKPLRG